MYVMLMPVLLMHYSAVINNPTYNKWIHRLCIGIKGFQQMLETLHAELYGGGAKQNYLDLQVGNYIAFVGVDTFCYHGHMLRSNDLCNHVVSRGLIGLE